MKKLLALFLLAGCAKGPEAIADRFVDYYLVEMDQARALPLASGLARDMLQRELRDVSAIRGQMQYMPADARPEIYYQRTGARDQGDRKIMTYDVTLKHKQDVMRKSAQVAVARENGEWKVVFYHFSDG